MLAPLPVGTAHWEKYAPNYNNINIFKSNSSISRTLWLSLGHILKYGLKILNVTIIILLLLRILTNLRATYVYNGLSHEGLFPAFKLKIKTIKRHVKNVYDIKNM